MNSTMALTATDERLNNKNVPWYSVDVEKINSPARELLEKYSQIPPDQVTRHVFEVRDRAWEIFPFPCIGGLLFLDLSIKLFDVYPQIVQRLKDGQKFLDLGCCFGQDVRSLVYDGAPPEQIWGTDLQSGFIELGYELFQDKETLKSHFLAADVLDTGSCLAQLDHTIDVTYAGCFFHLFDWEQQVQVAKRIIQLLAAQKGSLVIGKQVGHVTADEKPFQIPSGGIVWRHNVASFRRMWEEAAGQSNGQWRVNAWLSDEGSFKEAWRDADTRWLMFEIERLE